MRFLLRRMPVLLLCLCCALSLSGCAQLSAIRAFLEKPAGEAPAPAPAPAPEDGVRSLFYDDDLSLDGTFLSLSDVAGEGEVLTLTGESDAAFCLRAVGIGSATVHYRLPDGSEVSLPVRVSPARLAVFLLLGGSEVRGSATPDSATLRASRGNVYGIFPAASGSPRPTAANADDFVPATLTDGGEYSKNYMMPVCRTEELTQSGAGKYASFSAPLAYQWVEQTGEKVLVVNMAMEKTSIFDYAPGGGAAEIVAALFASVADTLRGEFASGHYVHARTGWFYAPDAGMDGALSEAAFLAAFRKAKATLDAAFSFSQGDADYPSSFTGIVLPRAETGYGSTTLAMNGVRAGAYALANSGEDADVFLLSDAVNAFADAASVQQYFSRYDARAFRLFFGYHAPATVSELYRADGTCTAAAQNERACETARNLLLALGIRGGDTTPALSFLNYDGTAAAEGEVKITDRDRTAALVPRVSPLGLSKRLLPTVTCTGEGVRSEGYRLLGLRTDTVLSVRLGTTEGEKTLSLRGTLRLSYAFLDYAPILSGTAGSYAFVAYPGPFRCGYISQEDGSFTPFEKIDKNYGWLYDGKNIWGGHGGIYTARNYVFGPTAEWDVGYAFLAPVSGSLTVSFTDLFTPQNDYLFAVRVNGKTVFPAGEDGFFTVRRDTTLDEMCRATEGLTFDVRAGDVVTFVCRRARSGETAEGCVLPVLTYHRLDD